MKNSIKQKSILTLMFSMLTACGGNSPEKIEADKRTNGEQTAHNGNKMIESYSTYLRSYQPNLSKSEARKISQDYFESKSDSDLVRKECQEIIESPKVENLENTFAGKVIEKINKRVHAIKGFERLEDVDRIQKSVLASENMAACLEHQENLRLITQEVFSSLSADSFDDLKEVIDVAERTFYPMLSQIDEQCKVEGAYADASEEQTNMAQAKIIAEKKEDSLAESDGTLVDTTDKEGSSAESDGTLVDTTDKEGSSAESDGTLIDTTDKEDSSAESDGTLVDTTDSYFANENSCEKARQQGAILLEKDWDDL